MKLNENQKIILAALVIVFIVGVLGALNYFKYKDQTDLQDQLGLLIKEEKKANDLIAQIPELRKKREDLAKIIDQYTSILPLEQHIEHEEFAKILDNYRRETVVVIQKVQYLHSSEGADEESDDSSKNFLRHRYRLDLIGTFPDFLRFINKIENHTRFLKIDEIKIKPLGADDGSSGLSDGDEAKLLELARVPFKEIQVIVSTYTYKKNNEVN